MKKIIFSMFFFVSFLFFSQQKLSLEECEQAFQKNNLSVLAQQYNISQADADVMQAKIWELPQANFGASIYHQDQNKFFDIGKTKSISVQQLFLLGGKRKYQVDFAKSNKEIASLQLKQLLYDLKSQMRETFYSLFFELQKLDNINTQLGYMNDLLSAYKVQTSKGNVSLKEEVRLQSVVMALNSDKASTRSNILGYQETLKTLTNRTEDIIPNLSDEEANTILARQPLTNIDDIKNQALENNANYLTAKKTIESSKLYLSLQKSLNVPDLTAGINYSQNGSAYPHEVDFGIGIPLPLWKLNNGNVKKAESVIEQNKVNSDLAKLTLQNQVTSAYNTWNNQYQLFKDVKPQDLQNLDTVYKGILTNFHKGNLSLIEFTDFMDSYRQTTMQLYEMRKQVMISAEELNRLTQTPIF